MIRVFSCGWKVDPEPMIESLRAQTHKDWIAHIYIDEVGGIEIRNGTTIRVSKSSSRLGAARNYYEMFMETYMEPNDIVAMVDLDDELLSDALEVVRDIYNNTGCWVTHGSYRHMSGQRARFNGAYEPGESFRTSPWRGGHLKTFKAGLIDHLPESAMKAANGQWLKTCSDLAIMIPMMEMAGHDRVKYIDKVIYQYNDLNPLNDHKVAADQQQKDEVWIRSRKPFDRIDSL